MYCIAASLMGTGVWFTLEFNEENWIVEIILAFSYKYILKASCISVNKHSYVKDWFLGWVEDVLCGEAELVLKSHNQLHA